MRKQPARARLCAFMAIVVFPALGGVGLAVEPLRSGLAPEQVSERPYREYVRQCLDLLIEHGTDRYGPVNTPTLVSILDVRTRSCPENPLPLDEAFRVARRGRRAPAGGNLYLDQPLLQAMYALSEHTDERRYATFADSYLAYVAKNLVDEKSLFWWGWHRHYDVYTDQMTGHQGNHHEIHVQQIIWPHFWRVDRKATEREIEAIWKWHVIDKRSGEVNRHADGQKGCDFAMSAGEILAAFAFLYDKTRDDEWLRRAELVADYYWHRRHAQTDLIPNRPNAGKERFDGAHFDTSITGLYCHRLLKAWQWTGKAKFRDQAIAYLRAYAKDGFDHQAGRFWGSLRLDGTPVPGPRVPEGYAAYEPRGHIDLWEPYVAGYEMPIYTAQTYALAATLVDDQVIEETARRWADCIRREFPPRRGVKESYYQEYVEGWLPHGTYAGLYGRSISFFLSMYRTSGQQDDLQLARDIADEALAKLYYRGLIRGHACKPYYEAADGVGYLLVALLQLDAL